MLKVQHFASFFLKFKISLLVKRLFFLLKVVFAMAILDLISCLYLASGESNGKLPPNNLPRMQHTGAIPVA
jgi:hypothetical protein